MNMKKKLFSLFASCGLLLAACSGGQTPAPGGSSSSGGASTDGLPEARYTVDANTPAWQLDPKEEITELTWYVNANWWNDTWGQDVVTKQIEKDLKVRITFIKGDDTKLNTLFASGDIPDIVTTFGMNTPVAKQANTWAYPLDDLAAKYDPYWNTVASPETMSWYKLPDGKTYGYPNYSNTSVDYEQGTIPASSNFLIRKDVYESIEGLNFETPEAFRNSLKLIKEKYPDLLPFGFNSIGSGTGSLGHAFQDFLGVPLETANGEFYDRNLDEEYLSWIKTLNHAHREGSISDDSFTDDGTAFEEKVKSGKYATILATGTAQMSGFLQDWMSNNPGKEYIAINGPVHSAGNKPTLNQSGISGWMVSYISKKAKDPQKAMQIFTYLQSEHGNILTNFGIENETFKYDAEGKIELLPEVQELKNTDPTRFKKEYRLSEFIFFGHDKYQQKASSSTQIPALVQLREWGKGKLYPHFILENIDPDAGTNEARNLSGINTQWSTTLVGMIRSASDEEFDATLQAYKDFLQNNGWEEIVKIRSERMKENKAKLNLQ